MSKIDLTGLGQAPAPRRAAPLSTADIVASPGFAPKAWQATAPLTSWPAAKAAILPSEDLTRVLGIARRPQVMDNTPTAEALVELITPRYARGTRRCRCAQLKSECITKLRVAQAWALYEIGRVQGLLGPIGVGHGKTILDLLAPLAMPDCKLAVLLVPPGLVTQLIGAYELVGEHFRMPSMIIHGSNWNAIVDGMPQLHVFPYSRLQRPESTAWLRETKPDTIIADEVHKLRYRDTATTARVMRFYEENPDARFCGWSGSLSDASIKDYAHLSALALRFGSPLPIERVTVEEWARAIDPSDAPANPGALLELCEPGEHVHQGFHRRLVETLGVVATTSASVDLESVIEEREAPPVPAHLDQMLCELRATMTRPDGEILVDALSVSKCARELASGFYYHWIFPHEEPQWLRDDWRLARKEWHCELRDKLKSRAEHLDSPLLCARAAMRYWGDHVDESATEERLEDYDEEADEYRSVRIVPVDPSVRPVWKADSWPAWRDIRDKVRPESEPVRVDEYLARDAAEWALSNRGVIWYEHNAFGRWVTELSGLPMYGGGPNAGGMLDEQGHLLLDGRTSIVCSIKAHGTGRDGLQKLYWEQLVANPMASGSGWEQLLGRLDRVGQKSPRVWTGFYRHTLELREHVDKALARALYVEATLGAKQKLRIGFRL